MRILNKDKEQAKSEMILFISVLLSLVIGITLILIGMQCGIREFLITFGVLFIAIFVIFTPSIAYIIFRNIKNNENK